VGTLVFELSIESWPPISNWLPYLVEEALKGSKKREKPRPWHPYGEPPKELIPFVEYAKEVIKRNSPIAGLAISRASKWKKTPA
jgi:hypothetical protein